MLRGLCLEHEFTVFSPRFANPCPDRISWVRVPVPTRPGVVLFVAFWVVAPLCYLWHRLRSGTRFDLVQMAETNLYHGDVCYAHFCFRKYLKDHWKHSRPTGPRRLSYWLGFGLRSVAEPHVFRRARRIVVPSVGLARELMDEYPDTAGKIHLLPNPVDVRRMQMPEGLERGDLRLRFGFGPEDVALVFVALGSYERKGLPLLLQAMEQVPDSRLKLSVIGGPADLRSRYHARASRMGLDGRVRFTETQSDVRPHLWAADALVLPSHYEVFPLVVLEGAAAGLPVVATRLNGVEEFLHDGRNGILVESSVEGIARGLWRLLGMPPGARREMGQQAQRDVARYDTPRFVCSWRRFYQQFDPTPRPDGGSAEGTAAGPGGDGERA
jgi:glycosyltransferase involved in cell wall biosynthesis